MAPQGKKLEFLSLRYPLKYILNGQLGSFYSRNRDAFFVLQERTGEVLHPSPLAARLMSPIKDKGNFLLVSVFIV